VSYRVTRFIGTILVWLAFTLAVTAASKGQRVWFKFNKIFINAHYDNEAFGHDDRAVCYADPHRDPATTVGYVDCRQSRPKDG